MKRTKTEENTANKANMTNRRDTRAKEKVSEKILGKSGKKRENEPRERTMTFMKLENIVREKRRAERRNNGNGRVENTLPVSRAMVWHPKQIRETCSGREENNTNRKRRHASFVPRTCPQSSRGLESAEKQTNARVQIFNQHHNSWVATQTRRLLNEHTCGSHARPISQTPALANPLRIASPAQNNKLIDDSGNSKQLSNKIVNLLAFLLLPRDDILHR